MSHISRWIALLVTVVSCTSGDEGVEPRFAALGGDGLRDTRTGMMWRGGDAGRSLSWSDAKRHCGALASHPSGVGWRLPTIDELDSLYDPSMGQPCGETATCRIDPAIHLSSPYLWSATAPQSDRRVYYDFSFGTQLAPLIRPALLRGVLCIRGTEGDVK